MKQLGKGNEGQNNNLMLGDGNEMGQFGNYGQNNQYQNQNNQIQYQNNPNQYQH